jgi:CRP-like cAMP-binding protein
MVSADQAKGRGSAGSSLDGIVILSGLTAAERAELARRCAWRRFAPGERILTRDGESREVLFVVEGELRIVNYASSGREIAYAVIGPGSHAGELAAIDGGPRSASVEALTDCHIASLGGEAFTRLLIDRGVVAMAVLRHLARIVRNADDRISELAVLGAMQRVYRELLRSARPVGAGGVISPLPTQESIASLVGTTRETVARALGQLVKAGVAKRQGRELLIRDCAVLEAMSEPTD